jgi:hypothetical protein
MKPSPGDRGSDVPRGKPGCRDGQVSCRPGYGAGTLMSWPQAGKMQALDRHGPGTTRM